MKWIRFSLLLTFISLPIDPLLAEPGKPTAEQLRFFENRIRPLLSEHCYSCHGPKKQRASLRLDHAVGLQNGGESEQPLAIPADSARSLLLKVVRQVDGVPAMPPKGKLTPAQIADLEAWIKSGAPYSPDTEKAAKVGEQHWAFQPVVKATPPTVKDRSWIQSPIDAFILSGLESRGLTPNRTADRLTLIRRVTYDLTGLPPTVAEIDAFQSDKSPEAFARVVDRLLASPAYGEKWGRHWLDIVRYADSNGLDENVAHGNAWRYRDYVIASLNQDKPYDQFLKEQIAGDLLGSTAKSETERQAMQIATGFLSLGPKVLAEPDPKKLEMDLVDEQIDTLGRSMLGMTFGCARCHDHKFDPVSTEDYYALAGIFQSTRTMEHFKKVAKWHEVSLASTEQKQKHADAEKQVLAQKDKIKKLTEQTSTDIKKSAKKDAKLPTNLEPMFPDTVKKELKDLRDELARLEKAIPELPSAMSVEEATPVEANVLKRGNPQSPGKKVARRFPEMLTRNQSVATVPASHSGRLELAKWIASPSNPLTGRVIVNRLWRWHFGEGLVRSVDNFGLLGETPSHPALLDFLANRLVDSGWSLKSMHRMLLLSSTYQMASTPSARGMEVDVANRWFWRFNPRRLEAEEIRDSLLRVAGSLDNRVGGPALEHVKNRDYLFDHTSKDKTTYDSLRRSVYLPVIRNNLYDVFQLFDATDAAVSNGDRATTTVATQALFLLNGPMVMDTADRVAADLLKMQGNDTDRLQAMSRRVLGHPVRADEASKLQQALTAFRNDLVDREPDAEKRSRQAWSLLVQVLLASSEFVYIN